MKKSDAIAADIAIYAMQQIQMAKYDLQLTGDEDYWNGEIQAMKYLLLHIDKLAGEKRKQDLNMPDFIAIFDRADEKRKEKFDFLWDQIWNNDIEF